MAIRYEAQSYKDENEEMIAKAGIKGICKPQKSRAGIRHNKFIVLIHKDQPVAVWTGSTNISAGGIFGHSNVGHVIWDKGIAQRYLDYWERLADPDVTRGPLVEANLAVEPTPAEAPAPPAIECSRCFSPRDDKETLETLHWYADLMGSAQRILCMTFAFNLDHVFSGCAGASGPDAPLRGLRQERRGPMSKTQIDQVRNTVIAAGAKLDKGDMENFLGEELTGFNSNFTSTTSSCWSIRWATIRRRSPGRRISAEPHRHDNDENMLVIRSDLRVADIYFGEFMRIFDHLYSRYIVGKMKKAGTSDPDAGFLKEDAKEWVPQHFEPGPKELRRLAFMNA